jgi:hypothetical protein
MVLKRHYKITSDNRLAPVGAETRWHVPVNELIKADASAQLFFDSAIEYRLRCLLTPEIRHADSVLIEHSRGLVLDQR